MSMYIETNDDKRIVAKRILDIKIVGRDASLREYFEEVLGHDFVQDFDEMWNRRPDTTALDEKWENLIAAINEFGRINDVVDKMIEETNKIDCKIDPL